MSICGIDYGRASFKGIQFEVLPVDNTGGRRIITHTYPFSDHHYNEDLGDLPQKWSVQGAFTGEDFRDQLQVAKRVWSTRSDGIFYEPTENRSHPVTLVDWSFNFPDDKLLYCEFTLELVERSNDPYPSTGLIDLLLTANGLIDQFIDVASNAYAENMAEFNIINDVLLGVEGSLEFVGNTARQFLGVGSYTPASSAISVGSPSVSAEENIATVTSIYDAVADSVSGNDVTVAQSQGVLNFFQQASEIRFAGSEEIEAQGVLFASYALAYYFEQIAGGADYAAVSEFRERALAIKALDFDSELNAAIDALIAQLGKVSEDSCVITETGAHHALVASYRIYGDVGSAYELLEASGGVSGAVLERLTRPCALQ